MSDNVVARVLVCRVVAASPITQDLPRIGPRGLVGFLTKSSNIPQDREHVSVTLATKHIRQKTTIAVFTSLDAGASTVYAKVKTPVKCY